MEKTYTVVLDTDPTANVTVTVANGDNTAVAVDTDSGTTGDQSTLTFTAGGDGSGSGAGNGNWATAQTVTVRALNDADALAESFNLTHSATATGSTAPYHNITIDPLAITTTDAGHGVVVSESSLSVAENDETATYTVVLKSQPSGNVEITTTSGATGTATASPATLTFTNSNWNTPKTVTVTGKGAGSTSISHAVATSADTTNYPTTTTIPSVAVTVTADARPAVTVTPRALTVSEGEDDPRTAGTQQRPVRFRLRAPNSLGSQVQVSYGLSQTGSFVASLPASENIDLYPAPLNSSESSPFAVTDDSTDEPNGTVTATLSEGTAYRIGSPGTATVRLIDNDPTTVTLAGGGTVAEDGSDSADVTVTLGRKLVAGETVTVPLAITGTGIAAGDYTIVRAPGSSLNRGVTLNTSNPHSAAQPAVVFTGHDTNTVQVATLRVTAVQDNTDEGASEALAVGFGSGSRAVMSNLDRASGTGPGGTTPSGTATVTITDDDEAAGVTISPTSLALTELGASSAMEKTYTVVLDTDPTANVTVTVANGDNTAVAVDTNAGTNGDQSTLTFTAGGDGSGSGAGNGNWATAQTVTVRALNDADALAESFNLTHSATATGSTVPYHNITIDPVAITTTDAGHGVVVSESTLSVAENDETATYTVALKSQPSGNVQITTTSGATGTATASPATLTFGSSTWNSPQTVTVTGKGAGSTSISHAVATSADTTNYPTSTTITPVAVTVTADNRPEVLLDTASASSIQEGERSQGRQLWAGIRVYTRDTPLSADVPYSYTVVEEGNFALDNSQTGTKNGTIDQSSGYGPTNSFHIDDDATDEPNGSVTVTLQPGAAYRVSPTTNTFTVTLVDNDPTTVTLAGGGTVAEDGSDSADVTVTLGRNLVAGETVTVPLAITGTGIAAGDYTIVRAPGSNLNSGVTLNTNSPHSASQPAVVFTGHGTNTVQVATLRVTAVQDTTDEGASEALTVGFGSGSRAVISNLDLVDSSATGTGGTTPSGTATVTITDDDEAAGVTISPTSLALTELGASSAMEKSYTVVLNTDPTANVTVTVANGDATAVAVDTNAGTNGDQSTLTFTAGGDGSGSGAGNGNWATAQTVTVRALNDADALAESFNLTHSATATGSTAPYHNIAIDPVAITTTDAGHGVVVSESTLSVAENDETATYTVVLKSQPGGNVQITTTSGATTTATASPATLTFSSSTWNSPQTVTVTGKGSGSTSISHAVATSADTTNYPTTTTIPSVSVTVTAVAAQVLDLSSDGDNIEGTNVTVTVTATGAGAGLLMVTGGTSLLTFSGGGITSSDYSFSTRSNWILSGGPPPSWLFNIDLSSDNVDEPNERMTVGLQNLPSGYSAGTTASFRIIDRDPTTVTLAGSGTVAEDGSDSADITVTLSRNLVAGEEVTVPLAISGTGIAGSDYTIMLTPGAGNNTGVTLNTNNPHSAAQPAVVFTGHGTNTVQVATLRVTAVQDNRDEGASEALSVGFGSGNRAVTSNLDRISGTGTGGTTTAGTATVTITDDDGAGFAISETNDDTTVSEASGAGNTDTYTVRLATEPAASVEITVTSGDTAAATVSPSTLTFTTSNWSTLQTVTVTGVDDNVDQTGNRSVTISHSATSTDARYNNISIANVTATVVDNDTAAVNISTATVSVTEASGAGRTDSYTVALATRPTHSVTISPTSATPAAATVSPATLTFTTGNWNTAQTVTVTGVDDNVDQTGNRSVTISHSATSTDGKYNSISIANVTATVVDNDGAGLSINETGTPKETRVTESGSGNTDTYTVVLDTQPTHSVTITPTSDTPTAATVSPATLMFTTSNWNTAQTVTVTGVDDNTDNPGGGREVSISHEASSTDTQYTFANGGTVGVTVSDDDATTVTLSGAAGNMEEGESQTFTITLGRGLVDGETLTAPLTFGGTATRGTDYTMTGTSATGVEYHNLSSGNARVVFNGPQTGATATGATITLRATADNTAESPAETVNIGLGAVTHTGLSNFGGVTQSGSLGQFTIADGTPAGVSITESGGSTSVTEAAGLTNTDTYTVVLKSQPTATVMIEVISGDPGAATVSPATLTFTPSNWSSPQMVTVTGVDDSVDQIANRSVTISHSATSTDPKYNGNIITIPNVTATVVDDDNAAPSALPAVKFSAAAYSGGEASGSRTVNVVLSATPAFTAPTSISYAVSGTATAGEDFTPLPGTVSITGGAGTVPITILQDQMADDGETIILTLIAANGYTVGTQGSATITITDDDGMTPPPPPSTLPVVSIAGGGGVTEGEEASFTVTATPAPPTGATISVNVRISDSGDFASNGQTGSRAVTIDASGTASFIVTTEDDTTQEEDGRITATVQRGSGYTPHGTTASASVTVTDDEVVRLSTPRLRVAAGGSASYQVALDERPTGDVTVTIRVGGVNGEGGAAPSPHLSPPGTSPWGGANTTEGGAAIRVHPATLTFTPANWDREQSVTLTAPEEGDLMDAAITLTHTANGGGHVDVSTTMRLTVVAAHSTEETKAWHLRLGRTLSHQVVTALEERWSAPPATGLQLTVAGETVPSATALAEHEGLLAKALGFEMVTPQALVEGSSFSAAPGPEGGAPHLAFWGQGAFSSFSGEQETLSLDGEVTTLLLGADWHTERWQAGAALSHSWGSGSYDGDNSADGEITSTVTGLFPYGRYALNPRLGLWAVAGHGWGQLSLKPDGKDEAKPNTTLGMVAVGLDGVLMDGGREGITLTTTADVLTLKTTSAETDGLDSSEGSLSRRRVGLEAVRPFPLSNGASLLPSMALGIRHDSGDAEAGYGLDLGAAIRWQAPQQGISSELKGYTLLTHTEESLQEQGLALSFSWQPHPSNRGPSLSLSHAMGATAAGDLDALLHPTTMEELDAEPGNGQRLTAELAYGFPAHNDHITLTPALALAFSPTSRNYGLLWSVAPYPELQGEPWELSLAGERQEQNTATSPVEHSLKLTFSTLF